MKIRIDYAAANAAASALCASEAFAAMTPEQQYDYLLHSAYTIPRRAETNTRKDHVTGERNAAPSPIASWIGKRESREDSFHLIADEAYTLLIDRYLPRADEEERPLSWAIARATWQAASRLYQLYSPGARYGKSVNAISTENHLTAPRPAAPESAAIDRCAIEDVTREPGAAAAVIDALDTIPDNAPQHVVARHMVNAAGGNVNTAIFAGIAAGVEQRYIADALDMTQQAVSYRLRKMRAAADK